MDLTESRNHTRRHSLFGAAIFTEYRIMAEKTLNAGIIGYGMIGKVHAYATATLPWYAPDLKINGRILGVATSRMETALRAQRQIGCPIATDDYRQLIDNPEIDVIHICTPNAEHLPALLAAIRAGKHIYCEKPIVAAPEEADELRKVLEETGYDKANQIAHHLRGFAALRRAKELIDAGRLGQLVQYRVGYYHASMLDPAAPWRWKHDEKGGSIFDLASHLVDLVGWLVGLPALVCAQSVALAPMRPRRKLAANETLQTLGAAEFRPVLAEDAVTIMTRGLQEERMIPKLPADREWEYPGAAGDEPGVMPLTDADPDSRGAITGIIEATKLMNGAEDELTLEIGGTRGSLRFSLMNSHYLEFFDATLPYGPNGGEAGWRKIPAGARYDAPDCDFPSPKSTTGWLRAHVASLAAFYQSVADGLVHGADFRQALRVQDVLTAIADSASSGQWFQTTDKL